MSVIPINTPSTPRDVKAAKSAVHKLSRDVRNIRRDIMNRKVDNLSEARRIAAAKESQINELKSNIRNSPVIVRSRKNKHRQYRMPVKIRSPKTRMRRRRIPLKRSIQANISARTNKLRSSKPAKPFSVSKPMPKAPKVKRMRRRAPRRSYTRRMPQSPVRSARKILSKPRRLSRSMRRASRLSPSRSMRKALSQESKVQARNALVSKNQLTKNKLQMEASRRARLMQMMKARRKQSRRALPKPDARDVRRITKRRSSKQTYVIPSKSGRPMRVNKSIYDRFVAMKKKQRDKKVAIQRRSKPSRRYIPRQTPTSRRFNPRANKALTQVRSSKVIEARRDTSKKNQAQRSMLQKTLERRRIAQLRSNDISKRRLSMLKSNVSKTRSAAVLQAKQLEKHLAEIRAKQESAKARLSPIKNRIKSFRKSFRMGEANLGEIRRNDKLADNHRHNMGELGKLENEANALGSVSRRLKQQEMLVQNQLQIVSDQIGSMNASTLYKENKSNLSETAYLEKCLSDKVISFNQRGNVSGQGIQQAKAIIRQFDKRQIPMAEAKKRIYRTLKANFTPKGGDMLKPDVSGLTEAIQMTRMQLSSQGKEFSTKGEEQLRKLLNKYSVGQIKTKAEAESQFMSILHNPRSVQEKVTLAQLNQTRALGIAATIRNRKSRQLPGVRKLTAERRAVYEKQRIAEEERLKASQERVKQTQSLAGFFPRTRSAMERMSR